MKTVHIIMLTAFAAAIAAGSPLLFEQQADAQTPPTSGDLGILPHGTYQCALPGDVVGDPYKVVAAEEFRIGAASKYRNPEGAGTYILRGDELTFTRGPKKGERFKRIGANQLRKMEDGKLTDLLCTRLASAR